MKRFKFFPVFFKISTCEYSVSCNGNIRSKNDIYALEPDEKNFKKLVKNTENMQGINLYNLGVWNKKDTLIFSKKAGRNSKLSSEGVPVKVTDIDSLYILYYCKGNSLYR